MMGSNIIQYVAFMIFCLRIMSTSADGYTEQGDIIFLLDGSDSISDGEFLEQKKLVEHFITQTDIGPDRVRCGVIVVSSDIGDTISFAHSTNKNNLITRLHQLQQPQDGSRIDLGINKLERMFFTEGRSKMTQIGVIVTDGRSKYPDASKGESEALKSVGIHLFSVGVGRLVDEKQLKSMAFSPNEYFYIEPFHMAVDKLLHAVRKLTIRNQLVTKTKQLVQTTNTKRPTTTITSTQPPTTTTTAATTTTSTTTTRATIVIHNPMEEDNDLNGQVKISVKSNILNGRDIIGTKVEKMFSQDDVPWLSQNSFNEPSYREPKQNDQTWYNPVNPVQAPWVTLPTQKSTPAAWNTYAPTAQAYQIYTTAPELNTATDSWSRAYRNPLAPIKLFSINMPIKVYQENGRRPNQDYERRPNQEYRRRPMIQPQITTRKPVPPTTTTIATTTIPVTQKQREVPQLPVRPVINPDRVEEEHLCYGSQYVDGVGYNADPKSCNEFIQCFYEGGQIKVERARCPFRMFWDQRLLLCRPATSMSCWRDPCFDFTVRSYDHKGNCRAHWTCRNGLSQAKCCPTGFAFSEEKQECVPEPGCTDWCEDSGDLTFTSPFASCRMSPFETNERFYFEEIPGLGMMTRSCPRGSQYNPGLCTCDRSDDVRRESCRPELILDFHDGFNDKSGNNLAVTPENVHIESGAARFDGTGKIRLWRFSGVSYGSQFTVTMKYKENPHSRTTEPMHLLSNCFNPEVMRPSIDIAISPNKGAMFLATTDKGGEKMAILKYNSTEWKTLSFVYDGKFLTGSVNGMTSRVPLRGVIEQRPSALILGACDYFGGFDGLMDDVKLYLCVPHGIT
uniref:Sushi-like protein n=1 Tax=Mytilus coruscus TaxID=42192 RepID=A0A0K0YB20_MYTCO|nr:sushi-like protein [Mytilus coruscus]